MAEEGLSCRNSSSRINSIGAKDLTAVVPQVGMVFTATAEEPKSKGRDFRIHVMPSYTGYIKPRSIFYKREPVIKGRYRFNIVGGPFSLKRHNYFEAVIFRELLCEGYEDDILGPELLLPGDFWRLKDFARGMGQEPEIYSMTVKNDLKWLMNTHKWR